jgi:hypothetical protein
MNIKFSWNSLALMLKSFISYTLLFLCWKSMYWLKTYPIQSLQKFSFQKFCVTHYKKKMYLDTTSLIKLWKLFIQHESFNLAPRSSQKASITIWWYWCSTTFSSTVGCNRMYNQKMQEIPEKSLFDLDYFDIVLLPYI